MSSGGATPKTAPIGWVFLDRHRADGFTIRWRRFDSVAYVLDGKRLGDHSMIGISAHLPVSSAGWTDCTEIHALGQRWLRQHVANPLRAY